MEKSDYNKLREVGELTERERRRGLHHLHIDYLFDLDKPSDFYVVYNRVLISKSQYGKKYKKKAEQLLSQILNLSSYKRHKFRNENPVVRVDDLLTAIGDSKGVNRYDLDLFLRDNKDGNVINLSMGRKNRNRKLVRLRGELSCSLYGNPTSERVDSCQSTNMRDKTKPQCYKYTATKIRNYTPYHKYVTNDTYCITTKVEKPDEEGDNWDYYGNLREATQKYIKERITPDELETYPKASKRESHLSILTFRNGCQRRHSEYWE